jgi:hypothetical protein
MPPGSADHGVGCWCPDENICASRTHRAGLKWIENQRKIKQKAKRQDLYFTKEMLDRDIIVKTGIEGLDPNEEEAPRLSRWMAKHPEKSAEYRQAKKARGQRFAEAKRRSVTA